MFIWFENADSFNDTNMTLIPSQYFEKKYPYILYLRALILLKWLSSAADPFNRDLSAPVSAFSQRFLYFFLLTSCLEKKSSWKCDHISNICRSGSSDPTQRFTRTAEPGSTYCHSSQGASRWTSSSPIIIIINHPQLSSLSISNFLQLIANLSHFKIKFAEILFYR